MRDSPRYSSFSLMNITGYPGTGKGRTPPGSFIIGFVREIFSVVLGAKTCFQAQLRARCQAVRAWGVRDWISRKTWMREQAAGVTPEMRLAWPSVEGRTRSSFSTISRERPEQAR